MDKAIEIYNYLFDNCVGYDNRVKANYLMEKFDINDHKTLRMYIESARTNPNCEYFIGSEAGRLGGYWIAISNEEKKITLKNLNARAFKMISNAKLIGKKKIYETD